MRSLRPPPRVIPSSKPPAHLFEPEDFPVGGNGLAANKPAYHLSSQPSSKHPPSEDRFDSRLDGRLQAEHSGPPSRSVPEPDFRGRDDPYVRETPRDVERDRYDPRSGLRPEPSRPSGFDEDVEREMRQLEDNIRKMLEETPGMAQSILERPMPELRTNDYPERFDGKYLHPSPRVSEPRRVGPYVGDPLQGIRSQPPQLTARQQATVAQQSPPRRRAGLSQLYETEDNLRMKAEKQAAYSQQLQQQMRDKVGGASGPNHADIQARRVESERSREAANFLDSFSKVPNRVDRQPFDPSAGLIVQDKRPPRRVSVEDVTKRNETGLAIGNSKDQELALKRAKQQEYRQQLDSSASALKQQPESDAQQRYPSTRRLRMQAEDDALANKIGAPVASRAASVPPAYQRRFSEESQAPSISGRGDPYVPSSLTAHQPTSYQPSSHQPSSYQLSSHQPSSYQPSSHQPSSYQLSSHQQQISPRAHPSNVSVGGGGDYAGYGTDYRRDIHRPLNPTAVSSGREPLPDYPNKDPRDHRLHFEAPDIYQPQSYAPQHQQASHQQVKPPPPAYLSPKKEPEGAKDPRKQRQDEYKRLLDEQLREKEAQKKREEEIAARDHEKFLREVEAEKKGLTAGGPERTRGKAPHPNSSAAAAASGMSGVMMQESSHASSSASKSSAARSDLNPHSITNNMHIDDVPSSKSQPPPPSSISDRALAPLDDDAAFEEMVRQEMLKERRLLQEQLAAGRNIDELITPRDPAPPSYDYGHNNHNVNRVPPQSNNGYEYNSSQKDYNRGYDQGDRVTYPEREPPLAFPQQKVMAPIEPTASASASATSPAKSPTQARVRLQQDIYGRNSLLTHAEAAGVNDTWMPSGKTRSTRQKQAQLDLKTMLDAQKAEDEARRRREKDAEKARDQALEERMRQAESEEARERAQKEAKSKQEARKELEAMQRKQEEEALARKNQRRGHPNTNGNANNAIGTHSNSTSTPSADSHHQPQQARRGNPHHNYDEIDSPLKDALMQQSNHQQGPGYSDHLRPPRRDLDFHDDPRYNHPSRNRDDHRYDGRDELDRAVQQQNNNYNNFPSNQSNYSSYDRNGNNYSMNHNMTNSSYNYRDSRDSYYQDSGSSYARRMRALEAEADAAAEAEERRFDLSLVAESRLIQPDTSGLLADLLPRRPAPPASSSSPAASSSLLEAYPRRERALDMEKSLASASTFLYMSEQTPLSLDQQRPPSSSSSASLTQRPTSRGRSAHTTSAHSGANAAALLDQRYLHQQTPPQLQQQQQQHQLHLQPSPVIDPASLPVAGRPSHPVHPANTNTASVEIPVRRVHQQSALPRPEDVPENRVFRGASAQRATSAHPYTPPPSNHMQPAADARGARGVSASALHTQLQPQPQQAPLDASSIPSALPLRSLRDNINDNKSANGTANSNSGSRPSSGPGGVQFRSKFAQEFFASAYDTNNDTGDTPNAHAQASDERRRTPPASTSGAAVAPRSRWDTSSSTRDTTVQQLRQHINANANTDDDRDYEFEDA